MVRRSDPEPIAAEPVVAADAGFFIGRTHAVCQDYAAAGRLAGGVSYAVVSDGCSSSAMTDVGARLLAHAAIRSLTIRGRLDLEATAQRAGMAARALGLPLDALDATLLVATADDGRIRVGCAGDGMIAARRRDGTTESWQIEFDGNAPGYPSYLLDPARLAAWMSAHGRRRVVHRRARATVDVDERWIGAELAYAVELDAAELDRIVVMSDGITSFAAPPGEPAPELDELIDEVLAIKTRTGRFLVRRLRRFLGRTCGARGLHHVDDFAAAALVLGDLP